MYSDTLCHLRYEIKGRRPEKWGTNSWFVFYDNAAAHQSFLVKDFLVKNNVTTLENPTPFLTWLQLIFFCSLE